MLHLAGIQAVLVPAGRFHLIDVGIDRRPQLSQLWPFKSATTAIELVHRRMGPRYGIRALRKSCGWLRRWLFFLASRPSLRAGQLPA